MPTGLVACLNSRIVWAAALPSAPNITSACCCVLFTVQQAPSAKDMSGLSKVWPQLQSLQLSHIAPSAVCDTCWDFRQLSGLTRLCLQFTPTADAVAAAAAMGASGPDSPSFLEAVTVKLHMDQMPQQLKQLQVTGCSLLVPYWSPFR